MGFITKSLVLIFVFSATIQAAEEFDTKAINDYIESRMRLPRIPGMALAIVKDHEVLRMFQPDFYFWLTGVAIVLFVRD